MKVHYITLWGENSKDRKLGYSLAALTKSKYILDKLKNNSNVDGLKIASFSSGGRKFNGFYFPHTESWNKIPLWHCFTFGSNLLLLRIIERILNKIQLFLYLLFAVKKDDIVIMYHERYFASVRKLARLFAKRKIVLEIEEVYTIAADYSSKEIQKEIKGFSYADGYILINNLIGDICLLDKNKPQIVLYGTYNVNHATVQPKDDKMTHVVYAGTLNKRKYGAWLTAESAKYLPENYHVHILGFGTPEEIAEFKEYVHNISQIAEAKLTYDGVLKGNEYVRFMQKCQIGISAQDADGLYNKTSFPSKILSYLSNGLNIVTIRLDVIEKSPLKDLITFFDNNKAIELAHSILNAKLYDRQTLFDNLRDLDIKFQTDLSNLINTIE